jgi:hypothetical protein
MPPAGTPTAATPRRINFSEQRCEHPDPMLAVIMGDVLFNFRSALDHLAVALAPRKRRYAASFPIELVDPWEEAGTDVDSSDVPERRRRFESTVSGMPREAVAVIKSLQPYNLPPDEAHHHFLYVLSSLENADKHRQLILLSNGVRDVTLVGSIGAQLEVQPMGPGIVEDGAILLDMERRARVSFSSSIGRWTTDLEALPTDAEMNVQISGTATVAIKVVRDRTHDDIFEVPQVLYDMLKGIERRILPSLEPLKAV